MRDQRLGGQILEPHRTTAVAQGDAERREQAGTDQAVEIHVEALLALLHGAVALDAGHVRHVERPEPERRQHPAPHRASAGNRLQIPAFTPALPQPAARARADTATPCPRAASTWARVPRCRRAAHHAFTTTRVADLQRRRRGRRARFEIAHHELAAGKVVVGFRCRNQFTPSKSFNARSPGSTARTVLRQHRHVAHLDPAQLATACSSPDRSGSDTRSSVRPGGLRFHRLARIRSRSGSPAPESPSIFDLDDHVRRPRRSISLTASMPPLRRTGGGRARLRQASAISRARRRGRRGHGLSAPSSVAATATSPCTKARAPAPTRVGSLDAAQELDRAVVVELREATPPSSTRVSSCPGARRRSRPRARRRRGHRF